MSEDALNHELTEGDRIEVRGHEYVVETIDRHVDIDGVIQWRLEALGDAPPARLEPSSEDGELIVVTYESIDEDQVTVLDGGCD